VPIGEWVIDQACRQLSAWRAQGIDDVPIAVNLSPSQLESPSLIERVALLLREHGVENGQLEMEVTESMMMADPAQATATLLALRQLGLRLSIDDFGTGYSSMAHLKRLPVDTLKLDRSFVQHVVTDPRDADLCAGIIALAHKLGLGVIAEGVETLEQCEVLAALGCDTLQGYFFSRPLPATTATDYLLRDRRR
jgi:EAL domain-containing protein (putative c-di-GMP-specific phosphodiesterase class I)